jgi:ABC-type transport system involved in cytochrome bd biosynthesis fused ATPase/permease subunit
MLMRLTFLQKLPFVLISFGLLFVHVKSAFIFLIIYNAIFLFLEYRAKKAEKAQH